MCLKSSPSCQRLYLSGNYVSPCSLAGGWLEKASPAGTIYTCANHGGKQRREDKQFVSCPEGDGGGQKKYFRWWDLLKLDGVGPVVNGPYTV